ncbi:MAG: dicarboxylate/amino acid:cation symporter [Aeromonadaceae bacterium]|nr:dicarboxylate/amino acid:cation symporter [Aeromonadaceae bacterium]
MVKKAHKTKLTIRIVLGMIAGILVGVLLRQLTADSTFVNDYLINGLFNIVGQIFVTSLKMLVVPLVFVSLVCGSSSLKDTSRLGRLGVKTLLLYLATTALAVALAIFVAQLVSPGAGMHLSAALSFDVKQAPSLAEVLVDLFPSNPIQAMAEGKMLQIIVFALLVGVAIAISGEAGERVAGLFNDLNVVIMKLVTIMMNIAPYGVFCLLAKLFATQGFEAIRSLASYFLVVLGVLLLHGLICYPLLLKLLSGLNPLLFIRKMRDVVLFGFSTSSSNATIPVTMETVTKKMGVSNGVSSFTIPLGATINMDGTAIMQGVATVFIANVYGIDLSLGQFMTVIATATLASIGTAGVPGVGLITLAMVLQQVGLPVDGIALIMGVDRLLDMTRTAVNITGDCMVTCVVAKSEGEMDLAVYGDPTAAVQEEELRLRSLQAN